MTYNTINTAVTMAGNAEGALLVGRYRVGRQLGQGGMGSVWLAEDKQLDNKPFAIKMLPAILVSNKRAYRQLKDEALVAMQLVHPNIVQIRAFEENNGNPFLVMDYIDGQTLDNYLAEHTGTTGILPVETGLPESDVLRILRPIAAALDYAHSKGVIHRDVKPGNVMIAKDGTPYILDFGIAREIQETLTRVTGKLSSGTLLYMSPEQLRGAPPKAAQDVYSFAAMVYECLKGEPPFVRGAIEDQIKNKVPEPLPGGTQLVASVMAGFAKKPENRPISCTAVLAGNNVRVEHVERVDETGGRAQTSSASQGGRVSTQAETGWPYPVVALKAILAVVALALVAIGGWWWRRGRAGTTVAWSLPLNPTHKQTETITLPGGATLEMIYVAPGSFTMGSPESEDGRRGDEAQHQVTLTKGFWLGKYEVTQEQWKSVMGYNPSGHNSFFKNTKKHPVKCVSWQDCQVFISRVNRAASSQFSGRVRLPTEAEWEYACRADSMDAYGGTGNLYDMGWFNANSYEKTYPVGQSTPNKWGFCDMHGNVSEWCNDWYDGGYYYKSPTNDPQGPASGVQRVLRGGCWSDNARDCRSANRDVASPGYCSSYYGFRLCCSAGPREGGTEQ